MESNSQNPNALPFEILRDELATAIKVDGNAMDYQLLGLETQEPHSSKVQTLSEYASSGMENDLCMNISLVFYLFLH